MISSTATASASLAPFRFWVRARCLRKRVSGVSERRNQPVAGGMTAAAASGVIAPRSRPPIAGARGAAPQDGVALHAVDVAVHQAGALAKGVGAQVVLHFLVVHQRLGVLRAAQLQRQADDLGATAQRPVVQGDRHVAAAAAVLDGGGAAGRASARRSGRSEDARARGPAARGGGDGELAEQEHGLRGRWRRRRGSSSARHRRGFLNRRRLGSPPPPSPPPRIRPRPLSGFGAQIQQTGSAIPGAAIAQSLHAHRHAQHKRRPARAARARITAAAAAPRASACPPPSAPPPARRSRRGSGPCGGA